MTFRHAAIVLASFALVAAPLRAQEGPVAACADVVVDPAYCQVVALGAESLLPAVVLAAEGGNPVPGTASTLGMRLTSMPRWTVGVRTTLVSADAPDLIERGGTNTLRVVPAAFAIDGSIGVLQGWNPLPTVGGVASLDVLFGASLVPLIASESLGGSGGWSWAAGARLGLLRESFTLPGVSVSGMFRQVRGVRFGDEALEQTDAYVAADLNVLSVRAAATKAILLLNLTGGVGWDRISGDVDMAYAGAPRLTAEGARMDRVTVFGSVSYTLMVLNFVLAGGVQTGPDLDDFPAVSDAGLGSTLFASAALRISI